jgi:hypothetical protein
MRKIITSLLALTLCTAFAGSASAVTLLSDGFSYGAGNLVPNGGWANYSGAVTDLQVVAGRVTGSGPNANDDHKLFAVQPTTSKTYACFEVVIPAIVGAPKPIYFAELKDAGAANLVSRVYVLPITGGWTFGISHSSTNTTTAGVTPWSASTLAYDTRYFIVINYDPVAKSSKLWVNPVNEASTNVTNTNAAIAALAVSGFGWRQSNAASALPPVPAYTGTADWGFSVDNLGVGTTFDDACFQVTPTKSSTWGQVKVRYK